ncbi:hypothetical protein [Lysinibacillus capsici]|uniref:hypothetical protein n=1 Tax=Lysinibacillus capsici TaxID=2115968 RepID=UPI003CFE8179
MNQWDKNVQLNLKKVEHELLQSNGLIFESYATFILRSVFEKFRCTRAMKDSGVDGFLLNNKQKTINAFFSIYAPVKNVTQSHKKKLLSDFNKILNYTSSKGYKFKKWHVVLNFEIAEELRSYVDELCEPYGINFIIYTPRELIVLITNEKQLFQVQAYILGFNKPFEHYSDFHYHVFFEYFIKSINQYYALTTTDKIEFIRKWEKEVCRYDGNDKKITLDQAYRQLIWKNIPEHLNFVYIYLPKENEFIKKSIKSYIVEQEDFLFLENNVWKNRHGDICVYAKNLFIIYGFLKQLVNDLENNIDSTLLSFMESQVEMYSEKASPLTNVW